MNARGIAYRVPKSTIPYQFNKYNLPMFNSNVNPERNLPGIANATVLKNLDTEGQALYRWRRRVRDMNKMREKGERESKKWIYNSEWVGFMRSRLHETLNYKTLVLMEEQAMLADRYGHEAVNAVLTPPEQTAEMFLANQQRKLLQGEYQTSPTHIAAYRHRIERDAPVSYLVPQGQQGFKLSFVPGKENTNQIQESH
eukprot:TRINITY_DN13455_c0_g1_i1.p1 TRINITY_DN13455_c0_g1~~TRINITY_DN13455_c0_g1_i1.p1  ORF type:complete len:215 (+),score=19.18 TRINITY_DN13455_c0_g1_i1:53-646(+)